SLTQLGHGFLVGSARLLQQLLPAVDAFEERSSSLPQGSRVGDLDLHGAERLRESEQVGPQRTVPPPEPSGPGWLEAREEVDRLIRRGPDGQAETSLLSPPHQSWSLDQQLSQVTLT